MRHLYDNEFTQEQIAATKKSIRGQIFFLLLCVDPKTADEYKNVDVRKSFQGLLHKLGGLNELLMNQKEIVTTMSLLQAALIEIDKDDFDFYKSDYRKLILDAGAEIDRLREGD